MRLGRLPHDPAAVTQVATLDRHTYAMIAVPEQLDRRELAYAPKLRNNDWAPCCTATAVCNYADAVETLNTGGAVNIADGVELDFYAACAGVADSRDAIAATDGVNALDVLRRVAVTGFPMDLAGTPGPRLLSGDVARFDPTSRTALARCLALLGAGYWGIRLYDRDMDGAGPTATLDDAGAPRGALVGGHLVVGWDYVGLADDATLRIATWGYLLRVTWRWLLSRIDEAYGLLFPQLVRADGTDWAGVNRARLRAENAGWLA